MNTLLAPASLPLEAVPGAPTRVMVRDLVLMAEIGVYAHEHGRRQRIRVGLDLETDPQTPAQTPAVTAADAIAAVHAVLESGHITLVETMAERVAAGCLSDPRVRSVRVRLEKLDIFPDAIVGVEFERRRG
mgnify:CR=1 FL=1